MCKVLHVFLILLHIVFYHITHMNPYMSFVDDSEECVERTLNDIIPPLFLSSAGGADISPSSPGTQVDEKGEGVGQGIRQKYDDVFGCRN